MNNLQKVSKQVLDALDAGVPVSPKSYLHDRLRELLAKEIITTTPSTNNSITFNVINNEMLKITEEGFYVNGVKVDADNKEAASVYRAFKKFLTSAALTRDY